MSEVRRPDRGLVGDCVHCGFCLPACPTYELWGEEMDSPRGRIHLIDQLIDGAPADDVLTGHLDACLGCLACVPACPSGVRYDLLIGAARAQVEDEYRRPPADRLLRGLIFALFPRPGRLRLLRGPLAAYRLLGLERLMARDAPLGRLTPRLAMLARLAPNRRDSRTRRSPVPREAGQVPVPHEAGQVPAAQVPAAREAGQVALPRVAGRGPGRWGRERVPRRTPARGTVRARVGMLTGCVQREFFPGVNAATARVLAAEGVEVIVPGRQGCCGALSLHTGRDQEARRFARRTVDAFRDVDVVVANAAGCGSALKEYRELLGEEPPFRVVDVAELLDELGPVAERHPLPITVAYHDACHLANAQGIRTAPRRLLSQVPGLTLREIGDGGMCCGSAGIYNILHPEPAMELGDRKADAIARTGADVLVTANPGCLLQIADAFARRDAPAPRLAHTVEILDESINGR
ncbi:MULTISPECIES: (Fe-S)-binding protein [Catenuloplanes]|uniref:Glycolate oxidase iron-sulfur subunit n=1 Tax=Catenuloplanes niger TaxID=587534 RepID=A0AAE3ZXB3_9ACTN|nr:heterodisulfide reductase-related iron-sulfur binding cluster [Catenuloplanes niger]MDR7326627.1 glycolate oxidase iron-sulfur subunit [Catenuloplanes niger]